MAVRVPTLTPDDLPPIERKPIAIRVHPAAERAIRSGHPWLFEAGIVSESHTGIPGTVAVAFDRKNRFLAAGLYDPRASIRVRILVHERPSPIGQPLFQKRIREALSRRHQIPSRSTTGFRILHGENDGMPGMVADLYNRTLVLKAYTPAWLPHLEGLVSSFRKLLAPERIFLLVSRIVTEDPYCPTKLIEAGGVGVHFDATRAGSDEVDKESSISFLETGLKLEAHPFQGHKTGFYLDQRENRVKLERMRDPGRVLDVFSHTGGFGLYAARGGAREVISVDASEPALAQARRHFELNRSEVGIAACSHRTIQGDAFEVMDALRRGNERFDTVVVDPPSFTRNATHRTRALDAYGALTSQALGLLNPGGLLVQASCSSRVESTAFYSRVERVAGEVGRSFDHIEHSCHPSDHPVGFPEGAYLKCLWGRLPT